MFRLAYFVSQPIQYQAPLLRLLAARPEWDLEVFFDSDVSLRAYHDREFGRTVEWDVPLVEGYPHTFLETSAQPRHDGWLKKLFSRDVERRLHAGRFDAVWVHGWASLTGLKALTTARRLGIPTLLRGESTPLESTGVRPRRWLRETFLRWLFCRVDAFLAIGTLNRAFYRSRGVPEDRIFEVPYAVDNQFFQQRVATAAMRREEFRSALGLKAGRPVILFAGKLIDKKRPHDLLCAYRQLSVDGTSVPDADLLFVGDGPLMPDLRREAESTGWKSIHFLGFRNQSELPALYDLSDVFVMPSDFEPWGLVLNEVMNAGKPVIVSDRITAAVDLVQEGRNGYIYPVGDVDALAGRLRALVASSERAGMGRRSREIIDRWGFEEDCRGLLEAVSTIRSRVKR